jgi:hypothetical protein
MTEDPRCGRCGAPLKTFTVKVPVYIEHQTIEGAFAGREPIKVLARYDEEQEIADCPRCTGAY